MEFDCRGSGHNFMLIIDFDHMDFVLVVHFDHMDFALLMDHMDLDSILNSSLEGSIPIDHMDSILRDYFEIDFGHYS